LALEVIFKKIAENLASHIYVVENGNNVMLCYMAICKAPLPEGYSEAQSSVRMFGKFAARERFICCTSLQQIK